MAEKVTVYAMDGNPVTDPEGAIDHATEITWNTAWPKGYMDASFKVRRSDVFADWIVKESYGVIIRDGDTIVYQGRIETMPRNAGGTDEYITIQCAGWYCVLEERTIRKRWVDIAAINALRWPDGLETGLQSTWVNSKRDHVVQVFVGTGDHIRNQNEMYRELYELPPSGYVRRVLFDYAIRSGEDFQIQAWNVSNPSAFVPAYGNRTETVGVEWYDVSNDTHRARSAVVTFQLGNTRSFELRWYIMRTDIYDQNDYAHVSNLRVEATYESGHPNAAAPTYTQGQLIKDVILLVNQKGAQLSTDFDQIGEPGIILDPFVVNEPTYAGQVVEQVAAYGDTALNTWGLSVWDGGDTSDGKPRVVFEARSVADYEYIVQLSDEELQAFTYELISDELYNNVDVQYVNERKDTRYRTSADNAALADAASIAAEYQRDKFLKLGEGDAARADYLGQRFVERHKDRWTRATISIQGFATNKGKGKTPANRVRAGQRIKLVNTGEVFFIRTTSYDAETRTVRISPDAPVDGVAMLFVQRDRQMGRLASGKS